MDWVWRTAIAQVFFMALFLMNLVSISLPQTGEIRPYFLVMIIYYWAIYRPSILSPIFVFLLGFFYDLVLGFPLGMHGVLFLSIQWILNTQRLFFMGQTYLVVWIGFSLTCLAALFLEWSFFSILSQNLIEIGPLINSLLVTTFLFPLVALIFGLIHKILPLASKSVI